MIVQLYLLDLECTMNWKFLAKSSNILSRDLFLFFFFSTAAI